ncbi:testis-specific gene A8 protein-like isoform X2 [Corvus kubaryi]|uniref:testis-specific gene A8 protein-like isoform X2 n=1 Tax=Corvus kubaryi TaxID=68294 RepID=UPI001C05BD79|nr:testis-specific gene A8 protein-like isoform X2 [Corvus kubaryi]
MPPAGDAAPNQEAAQPAANPEVALPQENPEAAAAAERWLGAAAPNAAGERETGAVSAAAPSAGTEQVTSTVLSTAVEQGPSAVPGAAVAPETAAAAPVPARSGPADTTSHKEAAVQTAAQPTVVCAFCSGSSKLSQSAPLRPSLFAPSVSELPLPDDSLSGSEADEVLPPGCQAAVATQQRKRLCRSRPWTFQDCTSCVPRIEQPTHEDNGSGSTGLPQAFWTADISDQRPQMTCTLILPNARPPRIQLQGLIDTVCRRETAAPGKSLGTAFTY